MGSTSQGYDPEMRSSGVTLDGVLAERSAWRATRCSVGRAIEVIGTRSALLLMREAYYGTTRFTDFADRVGITEAVAASRLRELVDDGLLVQRPYREPGRRTRHEYVLTDKGRDLLPVVVALMEWGDRYLAGPKGAPVELAHVGCGEHVRVHLACDAGHDVALEQIVVRAGSDSSADRTSKGTARSGEADQDAGLPARKRAITSAE